MQTKASIPTIRRAFSHTDEVSQFLHDCADEDVCAEYLIVRHVSDLPALAAHLHERTADTMA